MPTIGGSCILDFYVTDMGHSHEAPARISMMLFLPAAVVADDAKNLLKPVNKAESWRLEQHEGAQATLKVADDAVVFNATKLTGTNWHIQVFQTDLDLKEGKEYTLKLKLTASQRRNVLLVAMIDADDWHEIGLHEDLTVDKEVARSNSHFGPRESCPRKIGSAL